MRLTVPFAATIAAILMASQASIAGELFPNVVVTVQPLKPYVDALMVGIGQSQSLLRAGQDAHEFSLAPTQAQLLDKADIVITPDLSMNPGLAALIKKKHARVIELSKLAGADALPYDAENPWLTEMKASAGDEESKPNPAKEPSKQALYQKKISEAKAAVDPHFWLDPERMAAIATPLAQEMAKTAPESRSLLTANATALANHLRREVLPPLRALLSKTPRAKNAMEQNELPFLTYHAAYQYFLARFGLTHYGELTSRPEEMMGGKTMGTLLTRADKLRVRCLIGEQETTIMKRVATASGAKIILLSPEQLPERASVDSLDWLKNDYDRLLYKTAKEFAGCL